MKSYKFSELIEEITAYNTELKYGLNDIVGVTIEKALIPTIANLTQTSLEKFYIVKPNTFVYNPRTHGVRLGMGYNQTERTYITTWNNFAFKVKDTMLDVLNPDYLWMYFNRSEWDRETNFKAWGSSTIVFSWNIFMNMSIKLPEKSIQDTLVKQYTIIKNRIELKKKINDNLAEYLNCIYVELAQEAQETTALSSICRYVTEKAVFSDIESSVYISTENILPDKQGVASFGTTSPSERVVYFREEDVLVSNIRPYFKKMWFATTEGGCNADVLCFRALDKRFSYLLKSIMFQDGFFDYVMSGAKGTKMPRGDKNHIMQYQIPCFSDEQLRKFNTLASSIEQNQALNRQEMSFLEASKGLLLTTLSH